MNSEQYVTIESYYTDIQKMYESYDLSHFFEEFVQKQRDEKIDEILK